MAIINFLKEQRRKKGWTQQDLANRVGVSRQSIISIERGKYMPSLELALKIADEFDVPLDEIFKRSN